MFYRTSALWGRCPKSLIGGGKNGPERPNLGSERLYLVFGSPDLGSDLGLERPDFKPGG